MKFQSGILGVIIVVIALMGTIFGGYLMNVHQEQVTTTNYDPVTDVTSLFNFTEQPDYIEYNPAKNYTGYSLSNGSATGVDYTSSSTINQYYMSSSTTTTTTVDLNVLNSTSQIYDSTDYFTNFYGQPYGNPDANQPWLRPYGLGWFHPYFVNGDNLLTYLTSNNLIPANTKSITIHPKNSNSMVGISVAPNIDISGSDPLATPLIASATYNDYANSDLDAYGYPLVVKFRAFNSIPKSSVQNYWITDSMPNQCYLSYDVDSGSWTMDVNGQKSTDVYGLISYPRDNRAIRTTSQLDTSNGISIRAFNEEYTLSAYDTLVDVIFSFEPVYDYMKPSDGVSIDHNSSLTTDWSNGKSIGDVKIIFGNNGTPCSNTLTTSAGTEIAVSYNGTSNLISLNGGTPVDIGAWNYFVLDISPMNGTLSVIPVSTFNSYLSYTTANYVYQIGSIPNTNITKISWNGTSASYTFSVSSTIIQQTTKLLMQDAGLDVKNYFPLEDGYRLDINSFATYGDSITVNGITFYGDANNNPIKDTNAIYYDGKSYTLNNIQIIRDEVDGHSYLNFVNDRTKIDLGESTTDVVFFGGLWYFNTFLDKGTIGTATEYVWDWANSFTSIQSLVIFMALIIVFGLVANRFFHLGILDLSIMVAAIVVLYAVSEVIM